MLCSASRDSTSLPSRFRRNAALRGCASLCDTHPLFTPAPQISTHSASGKSAVPLAQELRRLTLRINRRCLHGCTRELRFHAGGVRCRCGHSDPGRMSPQGKCFDFPPGLRGPHTPLRTTQLPMHTGQGQSDARFSSHDIQRGSVNAQALIKVADTLVSPQLPLHRRPLLSCHRIPKASVASSPSLPSSCASILRTSSGRCWRCCSAGKQFTNHPQRS